MGAAATDFLQQSTYLSLSKLGWKELNKLNLCFYHLPGEVKGTLDACCNGKWLWEVEFAVELR